MKTNKIIYIITGLIILTLSSCEEQVLNKESRSTFTDEDVWSDIDLVKKFVYTQYNGLGRWGINAETWSGKNGLYASASDEAFILFNYGIWNLNNGTISPDAMGNFDVWNNKYNYIRNVNLFLKRIDEVEGTDEATVQRLKGEMKYIRAKIYHDLVSLHGGVPIVSKVFELDDEFDQSRDSYQDCIEFIVKELDEAKDMVSPTVSSDNWGRVTKAACQALKSEVLLYAASKLHDPSTEPSGPLFDYNSENKWQEASDAAKAVIDMGQFSLYTVDTWKDYTEIFLNQNPEIIFGRAFHSEYGENTNSLEMVNTPNGYRGWSGNCPTQKLVNDFEMDNGKMIEEPDSDYDPENPYENRDPRFYANIVHQGATYRGRELEFYLPGGLDSRDGPQSWNYAKTGYTMRKFMDENLEFFQNLGTQPYIYFRLGEIYLNYAEAEYHLDNEDEAREYVNKIRNRVNMPEINSTGQELLEDIRHERRIELAFEAHRFFDVRRWMIADETANVDAEGVEWEKVNENGELDPDGTLQYNVATIQERRFFPRMYYIPIPLSEIEKTGMEQNPGY